MLRSAIGLFLTTFILVGECKYAEDDQSLKLLAHHWRQKYDKVYKTNWEMERRMKAFRYNVGYINKLNEIYRGQTEFALNQFADLTPDEFQAKILMPKRTPPKFEASRYLPKTETSFSLPESFDWVEKDVVTSVKDQGDVGTCWAFRKAMSLNTSRSTTFLVCLDPSLVKSPAKLSPLTDQGIPESTIGNIEGQWRMMGQPLKNLSVEQVVECDGMHDPVSANTTNADCGVFGGWPYLAYQYVKKAGGLETWEDFWYCCGLGGKPGTCEICPAVGYNWTMCGPPVPYCNMSQSCFSKIDSKKFVPGLKVLDWVAISENETTIAEQLMRIGPLSVALDANLLQFYHRGVFNPIFCSKTSLDHAVLIVGFGVEKDLFSTKPYWKVKNSWGPSWGEDGYFRIYRGEGTCGINTQVTSAVLQKA